MVGDFAQTVASYPGGTGVASQTGTYGIVKFTTAFTDGSAGTESRSTTQDRNYRHGHFAAEPAFGDAGSGLADATGSHS